MEKCDVQRYTVTKKQPGPTLLLIPAAWVCIYAVFTD